MKGGGLTLADALLRLQIAVADVPIQQVPALLGAMEQIKAVGWTRIHCATERTDGEDELLTVSEVAQRLKVSAYRCYELIRRGEIRKVLLGKSVRVRPADLAAYLSQHRA